MNAWAEGHLAIHEGLTAGRVAAEQVFLRCNNPMDILSCVVSDLIKIWRGRGGLYLGRGGIYLVVEEHDHRIGPYYTYGEVLGQGGFGCVVSARTAVSKDGLAIKKIMKREGQNQLEWLERCEAEALFMKTHGHHPNIVALRDAMLSESGNCFYVVMPKATMDLRTLLSETNVLKEQPHIPQQAMKGILSGVKHLHDRGVAHFDLKPENIMVFTSAIDKESMELIPGFHIDSSCFQVSDFGCADGSEHYGQVFEEDMPPQHAVPIIGHFLGSPAYSAPEIVRGKCTDGRLSDMWSCGIILYVLVRCYCPFDPFECGHLVREGNMVEYEIALAQYSETLRSAESTDPKESLIFSFLKGLLTMDPLERLSAGKALEHPWLKSSS